MTRRKRRLVLISSALAVLSLCAVGLVLVALRDNIIFFYGPSELAQKAPRAGQRLRIGGLVKQGSLVHEGGRTVRFAVTDTKQEVEVTLTRDCCPTSSARGKASSPRVRLAMTNSFTPTVFLPSTRDVYKFNVTSGHCPPGRTEKVDCWPMPEVKNNLDMTTGKLGLSDQEENLIVAFLQTLTDGFTRPYSNSDTFTGTCMNGGSARTQGNEFLIPRGTSGKSNSNAWGPPRPPCPFHRLSGKQKSIPEGVLPLAASDGGFVSRSMRSGSRTGET